MTRKDYIGIAGAIRRAQEHIRSESARRKLEAPPSAYASISVDRETQLLGVLRTAGHIGEFLASDNPRFDQALFMVNCGCQPGSA